jgi:hypothetical protein
LGLDAFVREQAVAHLILHGIAQDHLLGPAGLRVDEDGRGQVERRPSGAALEVDDGEEPDLFGPPDPQRGSIVLADFGRVLPQNEEGIQDVEAEVRVVGLQPEERRGLRLGPDPEAFEGERRQSADNGQFRRQVPCGSGGDGCLFALGHRSLPQVVH